MNKATSVLLGLIALVPSTVFADTSIQLDVAGPSGSIYSSTLTVTPCPVTDDVATTSVSAKCALEQAGLSPTWSNYGGDDWFLTTAGGVSQDFGNNLYWGWWSDLAYGDTALNKHELHAGESLLVALGIFPLRVSTAATTVVGATTTITVEEFGFDASFNGVWIPSVGASIALQSTDSITSALGTLDLVATSTDPLVFTVSKNGFVPTTFAITPITSPTGTTPISTTTPSIPIVSGGGGTSTKQFDVSAALSYLASRQQSDGSFGAPFLSDWVALALSARTLGDVKAKLVNYLTSSTPTFSSITDYERHAMALMALGINPYSGTSVDYINPVVSAFDGTQIGDAHLDNDDIFALFPLLHAGYTTADPIIQKTVAFILSAQQANGSWDGSIDMTAAAAQALTLVRDLPDVSPALTKAATYIHSQQVSGGYGNSFSTSWALQAAAALGESWVGADSLALLQESDGGVEPLAANSQTRLWATAYAVPAILGTPWGGLLRSFSKPANVAPLGATDLIVATSTLPALATTTIPRIAPTPTPATTTATTTRIPLPKHVVKTTPATKVIATPQMAAVAGTPSRGFLDGLWNAFKSFGSFIIHIL